MTLPIFMMKTKESFTNRYSMFLKNLEPQKKKKLTLFVSAKIRGLEWDTEFNFHKEESVVLKRDLMPYFEEIEDYETCNEINNLYKELTL